jgi:hypothetical protein
MIDKKELKKQYRNTIRPMGIFQLKNLVDGKVFIGSSLFLDTVYNKHFFQLKMNSHMEKQLQEDWNKYGEANFEFSVLDTLKPVDDPSYDYAEDLKILLDLWMDKLQPYGDKGYHKAKINK